MAPAIEETQATTATEEEFLALARKRWQQAADADLLLRQEEIIDWYFRRGATETGLQGQWTPAEVSARRWANKPTITINRIEQFLRQVNNEQRQKRPSARVHPKSSARLVKEKAKVVQGIFREIELRSVSEWAYDVSFEQMTTGGRGYLKARTEWVEGKWEQEIIVEPVLDPFSVYTDPNATRFDRTDADFKFLCRDYTEEAMRRMFPTWNGSTASDFASTGDNSLGDWYPEGQIRVAEYYYIERTPGIVCKLIDDTSAWKDELTEEQLPYVIDEREEERKVVRWAKITGTQILEEGELPGDVIPIWQVTGNEYIVDGRLVIKGMVRDGRKAQECYNYWVTLATELMMLSPRAKILMARGQGESLEKQHAKANTSNSLFLEYNLRDVNGELAPRPELLQFDGSSLQGIFMMIQQADADLKACMGIYAASLGDDKSPETSGRAILARQSESDNANANYADNFKRTFESMSQTLLKWMRVVYTAPQVKRIVYPDDSVSTAKLNQVYEEAGIEKLFDMTEDDCDVVVTQEPSYATKRQQNSDTMLELLRVMPVLNEWAPDIVIGQMDFPDAQALVDRCREKMGIQDDEQNPVPPQAKAQIAQLTQMVQALTKVNNVLTQDIESKKAEYDHKERMNSENNQVKLIDTVAKLDSTEGIRLAEMDLALTQGQLAQDQAQQSQANQIAADADKQGRDQQHQTNTQLRQQSHEGEMTAATMAQDAKMGKAKDGK